MPYDEDESSCSDSDSGFDEDMEALRKACSVTGVDDSVNDLPKPSTADSDYGDTYASEDEDIELLRSIQQRFSVPTDDIDSGQHPFSMKPLNFILPSSLSEDNDDYGDDFETLRAIQRRFSQYHDNKNNKKEKSVQKPEQVGATNIDLEKESSPNFFVKRFNNGQGFPDCVDGSNTNQNLELSSNITPDNHEPGSEIIPAPDCGFPKSAQAFVEAIKKNRICQKFIRNKLGQIEAKMEENKKLRERVKILKDFQVTCRKKTGRALSQKKDPRIQLISVLKQRANAAKDKEMHAIYQGPAENSHVADYRDAMSKYPFALTREPWSIEEKENLLKGIKQQFQKMIMQNHFSGEDAGSYDLDSMLVKIRDHEISSEEIRSFLPNVNWDDLASMYVVGRSGPECQSRWMSCEDPLINHEPWSLTEDKKLLYTVQNRGLSNWIEIADALGTNRTPFQCLSRFQRSLNASIIKNEWTPPEDEELRNAVAEYGDSNWQLVASTLEGRTGTQCSNRWKKSLNPMRERVGKWAPDEDKRLKIAVKLFGAKNWNKIARFVPGRTQVQCRERWVNCLDPALNMNEWTPEEDLKLKQAIGEHGYQWSKIAACVPPRTDSQCRRRWKQLLPHEVPVLQRARKMKKAAFISNFVDREDERPALTVNDFIAPLLIEAAPEKPNKRQRSEPEHCEPESSSGAVLRIRSRRARKVTRTEKTLRLIDEDDSHADIKANPRLKNKTRIASQETDLSDLNNGEGDNSNIKKKATRKGKRRGNKEHKEINGTDAISNQKTRRPRSRANRLASVNIMAESVPIDVPHGHDNGAVLTTEKDPSPDLFVTEFPEVDITGIENGLTMGLSDLNNGVGGGTIDGDNFQTKKEASGKRKRKQSGNKEHEETIGTWLLNQKSRKLRLRGCHLASVNITESDPPLDAPIHDLVLTTERSVIDHSSSLSPIENGSKNKPNILSQETGFLDLDSGEVGGSFVGDNSETGKKVNRKRKRRGNKEREKTDETLEHGAILKQKTTKPRSRANRVRRLSIGVPHENGTTENIVTDLCSSPSPHPSATEAPPVAAITGIENDMSTNKPSSSREIKKTYKRRKVSCKKGGNSDNGDRQNISYGEIGDKETIGSFFSKLKKRTPDEETIGSFFSKLKRRKVD